MYEQVSSKQQQAVSNIMMSDKQISYSSEMDKAQDTMDPGSSTTNRRVFGNLTNCNIGKICININPTITCAAKELVKDLVC